ncbi:hypothetical protein NBZ79_10540 [Sneathiella marina]|uniref:Uncharacterized protein n=1 Tax=Sneathiella marina TaxID=2950108 RepID=A0ABY4VYE5_9PROT|nr:hypothetical protein [Sneathiella marina]USG59624.1 hypothetical protein NBZ79_10540 [Sneathiella marina]
MTIVSAFFLVAFQAYAEDVELEVSKENCSRITKYVAEQDVNFKPGVDVHGKPVVPADLDGTQVKIPDTIFINLALPFKDLLNNYNPKLKNAEVYVGLIEYNISSGKMLYNGQELSDPALNAIAQECQKRYQ